MSHSHEDAIPPIAIVVSAYTRAVTGAMESGARDAYLARGGDAAHLGVFEVPGAFELVAAAAHAVRAEVWKGVVCLGCVIRGETTHDEHLARAVTHELASMSARSGTPIGYGVVTTLDLDQALARAGGDKGNKGADAMHAVLDTLGALGAIDRAAHEHDLGTHFVLDGGRGDKMGDRADAAGGGNA